MCRAFLLPAIVLYISLTGEIVKGYNEGTCYCAGDMDATLQGELDSLPNVATPPKYHYTGIEPQADGTFLPCICSDMTRVRGEFKFTNAELFDMITNGTHTQFNNFTKAIGDHLKTVDTSSQACDFDVYLKSATTSPYSSWYIEIILKQYLHSGHTIVNTWFKLFQTNNAVFSMDNVGVFDFDPVNDNFEVLECKDEPLPASSNGQRDWPGTRYYPGTKITYSCDHGYFVADETQTYSLCSHGHLNWTEPLLDIKCKKGCQSEPPEVPFFTVRTWDKKDREDGDMAMYNCMDKYRPKGDVMNGTSTCNARTTKWSPIETKFACEIIVCDKDKLPQNPPNGKVIWNKSVNTKTVVKYICLEDFFPSEPKKFDVICDDTGEWINFPINFRCLTEDEANALNIPIDDSPVRYSVYTDGQFTTVVNEDGFLLFSYITFPSIIGMGGVIVVVLCVTRTNSFVYMCCSDKPKKKDYIEA